MVHNHPQSPSPTRRKTLFHVTCSEHPRDESGMNIIRLNYFPLTILLWLRGVVMLHLNSPFPEILKEKSSWPIDTNKQNKTKQNKNSFPCLPFLKAHLKHLSHCESNVNSHWVSYSDWTTEPRTFRSLSGLESNQRQLRNYPEVALGWWAASEDGV